MIDGKTVLALIPARGGSKGVPRKNIRDVAGKPLIAWSIEAAKSSRYIDRLILSSDDPEIIAVAEALGCEVPFIRPRELAADATPGIDPVLHALKTLPEKYDYVVMLQPTSPLRSVDDIDGCIEQCRNGARACVSVTEPEKSPYWMYFMDSAGKMRPVLPPPDKAVRRQDLPQVYALNGAVYVAETDWLKNTRKFVTSETTGYLMPQERSLDIDTEHDLKLVSYLLS